MARLTLYRSNLEAARHRAALTPDEDAHVQSLLPADAGSITLDPDDLPLAYAKALLEDAKLKPHQRAVLALRAYGMSADRQQCQRVYDLPAATPLEFGSILSTLPRGEPNAELQWNGRWYPVAAAVEFTEDEFKLARHVRVTVSLGLGGAQHDVGFPVDPGQFTDADGRPTEPTVLQVLESLGFRGLRTTPAAYNLRLVKAEHAAAEHGRQVWVKGAVLDRGRRSFLFGQGLNELAMGTPEVPRRAIVEPTLELHGERYYGFGRNNAPNDGLSPLPVVRVFSLDHKAYVFADVDDIEPYDYDATALDRLFLPKDMKGVLRQVFETPTDQLFGDLIRGKHGGIVILACGNPGVGKTLTAEVYAEMAERPLYVLEFGEMGTTVEAIENNLELIFARVVRWRAVLQFDECEIFLAQRGGDLERSAIVAIFLRMLDYYEGLLFLTSNRPADLDEAIRSRVMLRLDYPDLDPDRRAGVWRAMLDAADMTLTDDDYDALAAAEVNGRQIRNLTRLARILHPDRAVTTPQVLALLDYGCR